MNVKQQKTIERDNTLIGILKKGETMTGEAIGAKFGLSSKARWAYMHKLMKEHKEIQNISRGKMPEYKWVEDKPVVEKEPIIDAPVMTALLTASLATGKALPGEVWQTEESNGAKGMIFVLNSLNNACQCIKLYPDTEENRTIAGSTLIEIEVLGRKYVGDPTHVTFKPLKYCSRRRMFPHMEKLKEVREILADIFGIPKREVIKTVPAEPEVKIVYRDRVVEKEPEKKEDIKIPDNYVDGKDAYIVCLERELDIWKEVAMKLLEKNS